jgi:hypothetical protein
MNRLSFVGSKGIILIVTASIFFFTACSGVQSEVKNTALVAPGNDSVRYMGRINDHGDSVAVYWPGTTITIRFKGNSLKALLKDKRGLNYFNVVIDGDSLHYIRLDSTKRFYTLATGLSEGEHTIELIKRNEWDNGETWFYGFGLDQGKLMALPPPSSRVIEFFGNSITAGYAIENYTGGDSPDSIYTNNYYTYAPLTARHFKADYYCTVKSGIGILISWFPLIMPEMYNRLDPLDSSSRWDFKKVQPDIVVINLFQNDSWLTLKPEHLSFKQRFGTHAPGREQIVRAYRSFVEKIRAVYPDAHIICALGNMDAAKEGAPWPAYIKEAIDPLHDPKMYSLIFPYMNKAGHPRKEDNEVMAKILIDFIEKNIPW